MQYRLFPDESINSVIQYCAAISMIKPMKSALCLFLLSMMPMLSWAVGDECVLESNPNLRLLCQAQSHASAFYCDKNTTFGLRSECVLAVRTRQRIINFGFKPIDQTKSVFR